MKSAMDSEMKRRRILPAEGVDAPLYAIAI
jgi:hypothetical protein